MILVHIMVLYEVISLCSCVCEIANCEQDRCSRGCCAYLALLHKLLIVLTCADVCGLHVFVQFLKIWRLFVWM